MNIPEWVGAQVEQIGFTGSPIDKETLMVEVGSRSFILLVQGEMESCEVIGGMLKSLQKLKTQTPAVEGVVFVFGKSSAFTGIKNKVVLKEFRVTEQLVSQPGRLVNELVMLDQNPRKTIDVAALTKSLGKIRVELKKVVDAEEIKQYQSNIKKIQELSAKWSIEKLYAYRDKLTALEEKKSVENMNSKLSDFESHIKLYDEVRRGLWDKATETAAKIHSPSDKLKQAIEKGKTNIEGVLKVIKADTAVIETEIRKSFQEKKDIVAGELKDAASNVP